jgi:hypothetical protein
VSGDVVSVSAHQDASKGDAMLSVGEIQEKLTQLESRLETLRRHL